MFQSRRNLLYSLGMNRPETIASLRRHADEIRSHGVTALYLFGSAARGEEGARSDIDLFVD